jgi:hypothetical protein
VKSFFVTLALAATALPSAATAQEAAGEILAVIQTFFDGMRSKDTSAIRSATHPSARLLSTGRNEQGMLRVDEMTMDRFLRIVAGAPGKMDEKVWNPEVRIDGDLATVWTPYAFYYDGTFTHCGYDAFQLARTGDGWKIVQIADTRQETGCPEVPADAK